jgi:hypothetical protein
MLKPKIFISVLLFTVTPLAGYKIVMEDFTLEITNWMCVV